MLKLDKLDILDRLKYWNKYYSKYNIKYNFKYDIRYNIRYYIILILIFSFLIFQLNLIYSINNLDGFSNITKITQINFLDNEFIQIYSDKKIDFNNSYLVDSSGIDKKLKLIQLNKNNNSNIYLLIGKDFIKNNNISYLESKINLISTNNRKLGNYGLKNSGENFSIINISIKYESNLSRNPVNTILNLSFKINNNLKFNFRKNQSLYFYINSNKTQINISNPLKILFKSNSTNKSTNNLTNNLNNQSYFKNENESKYFNNSNKLISNESINYSLKIKVNNILFEDKLKFKFEISKQIKNFTIKYSIKDIQNNTIRGKKETKNLNYKYFSPSSKIPKIYFINAYLYKDNILLNTSNLKIYYFPEDISQNNYYNNSILNKNSRILIKNKNELLERKSDYIELEIYRNETRKKTISIYLNNNKINTFIIPKNTKIITRTKLNLINKTNLIKIIGLDYNINFKINAINISNIIKSNKSIYIDKYNNNNNYNNYTEYEYYNGYSYNYNNYSHYKDNLNYFDCNDFHNNYDCNNYNNDNIDNINNMDIVDNSNLISMKRNNLSFNKAKTKLKFSLKDLNIDSKNSKIQFRIDTNYNNLNLTCYVLNKRTKISSIFNYNNQKDLSKIILNLNNSKILNNEKIQLKLLCKYKKINNKNYIYKSLLFNYSKYIGNRIFKSINNITKISNKSINNLKKIITNNINNKNNKINYGDKDENYNSDNMIVKNGKDSKNNIINISNDLKKYNYNNLDMGSEYYNLVNDNLLNNNLNKDKINKEMTIYESNTEKLKKNSINFLSFGSILLLIPMIIFW